MEWVLFHKDNMSFSDPLSRKIVTLPMSELWNLEYKNLIMK
jgi:hypothetical protein